MSHDASKVPEPVRRLLALVAVLIGGAGTVYFMLPSSMTDTVQTIAAATDHEASRDISYAGAGACAECHEDEVATKAGGYHRNVACETCHGAAYEHTQDPMEVKPPAPRDRQFCPTCHGYNASRPRGFPQINPVTHNPLQPCITCHKAHDPKPPQTPSECTACHGEIGRIKAVSHHALLECTVCHQTPEQHKVTPRTVRPSKPVAREFCGQCHGLDAKVDGPPKIDITKHGSKYLCWQCHYPHMPEVD